MYAHGIVENKLYISIHIHDQDTKYEKLDVQENSKGMKYVDSSILGRLWFHDFKVVMYDM